jgi:ParB/RepB/Spo0J family partition protein
MSPRFVARVRKQLEAKGVIPKIAPADRDRVTRHGKRSAILSIGVGDITVPPNRTRRLRPETIDALAESIAMLGQLEPIIVTWKIGTGYTLVFGRHRLEALKKLGHDVIKAELRSDLDADQAILAEIDENLIRADLSPAERKLHIARRKELYEKIHPETKHGAVGRRGKSSQNENSYVEDTARKTGKGRSTIARDITHAKQVIVLPDIVGTSLDKGDEIDALAKLSEIEQVKLADRAKSGEQVTAKHAAQKFRRRAREAEKAAHAAYMIAEEALQTLRGRANGHGDAVTGNVTPTITTATDSSEALAKFKDAVDALMPRMNREDLLEAHKYALDRHDAIFHDPCHAEPTAKIN